MVTVANAATTKLTGLLSAPTGLPLEFAKLAESLETPIAPFEASRILNQQVAFDLAEKTAGAEYPSVYAYCEKLENTLREKFRRFSGRAHLIVEVRVSHDRLESLTRELELCAGAVMATLDGNRGTWAPGYFYTGGYDVQFGPVKHGGRNFIQTAKVSLAVDVSVD